MRLVLTIVTVFILFVPSGAQDQWEICPYNDFCSNIYNPGNRKNCLSLDDVHFIDRNIGFIAGSIRLFHWEYGSLYKTENGGDTWNVIYDTAMTIPSIHFLSEPAGFIFGDEYLFTTDGGDSWSRDSTMGGVAEICFVNDSIGFAIRCSGDPGCVLLQTYDRGENWDLIHQFEQNYNLNSFFFIDEVVGWVLLENDILKFPQKSREYEIQIGIDLPLRKIHFIDYDLGWISGGYSSLDDFQPLFLRSVDGGETWTQIPGMKYLINDFYFETCEHGWAVGEDNQNRGVILETFDSGFNWKVALDSLPAPLKALNFTDGFGWAIGGGWNHSGLLLKYEPLNTPIKESAAQNNEDHLKNYPNPFRSATKISYQLPVTGDVELSIYDLSGRKITTLVNESQQSGPHQVEWSKGAMNPGIYICELRTGQGRQVIKMIKIY